MTIPNPNPNIADGIKSDNKTYSSNKIESLIKTATELPIPEAGDAGKVLTVNSDSDGYELDAIPTEVPEIASGDAGKIITVNAGETAYELATPVAPTSIIDDAASSESTVYSSDKVDTLLSSKVDTSTLSNLISVTTDKIEANRTNTYTLPDITNSALIIIDNGVGCYVYVAASRNEGENHIAGIVTSNHLTVSMSGLTISITSVATAKCKVIIL